MSLLKSKKNFFFISGSRAEYGLLKNLIISLSKEKNINTRLIITGTHLLKKFGKTINEIKRDKIKIFKEIKISSNTRSPQDISFSSVKIISGLSNIFKKNKPDLIIVLGDRYEIFLSCYVATLFKIPIAHICGGEETKGSYDNQFRHAISKMSHIHFVTNKFYKKKIERMGENAKNDHDVGSLAFSDFNKIKFKNKIELEKKYGFNLKKFFFLVTMHPETLKKTITKDKLTNIFKAIKSFKNFFFIFTSANNDQGGNEINLRIKDFVKKNSNTYFVSSFGKEDYFSMLRYSSGVIGNSSSGVIEVPYFNIGTINIGQRQFGRISSKSVINTNGSLRDLKKSILKLNSSKFNLSIKKITSPYYKKNTVNNIKKILIKTNLQNIILKSFIVK